MRQEFYTQEEYLNVYQSSYRRIHWKKDTALSVDSIKGSLVVTTNRQNVDEFK